MESVQLWAHECDGREQQSGLAIRPRAKRILLTAEQSRKHHYAQLVGKIRNNNQKQKLFSASVCRHIHFHDYVYARLSHKDIAETT